MRAQLHFQRLQLRLRQLSLQLRSLQFVRAVFAVVVESVNRAQDRVVGEKRRGELQGIIRRRRRVEPLQEFRFDHYLEDRKEKTSGEMYEQTEQPASPLDGETARQPADGRREQRPGVPIGKSNDQGAPPGHRGAGIGETQRDAHCGHRAEQRPNAEYQNPSCPTPFEHCITSNRHSWSSAVKAPARRIIQLLRPLAPTIIRFRPWNSSASVTATLRSASL